MIVNTPLPLGTAIETRAHVTLDETPEMIVRAEPLRVRSTSALPIVDPNLPFSVLDAATAPQTAYEMATSRRCRWAAGTRRTSS